MKYIRFYLFIILFGAVMASCHQWADKKENQRLVTDAAGRKVLVPDTINSVIALRAGALRLLCYMELAEKVGYIEANEQRRFVPYLLANPNLKKKPLIGAGNNYDAELLATSDADLIVATFMTSADADRLQEAIRKPVILLEYGDLKNNKKELFKSLRLLGELFYKTERAQSLENYISNQINEFKVRTTGKDSITAYIGGVAYRGAHGISSTEPGYPPFNFLSIKNVASSLGEVISSPISNQENAFIDLEQLLIWNPEYIFMDAAGESIWMQEVEKDVLKENLRAFQTADVYSVFPYNWYTTNYENIICNSWFIGKTAYPDSFDDIDVTAKCREIYTFFLGVDVYDEMADVYKPYHRLTSRGKKE